MLKNVLNLIALSLYRVTNAMGATFEEEDEDKLQGLVALLVIRRSRLPTRTCMHLR